jgi:trk system potassium uptake protein TrkA
MYVIVVGAGKVGYHLTRALIGGGHEVTLIEKDARQVAALTPEFGEALVVGDGCEVRVMQDVGMGRADCVVAVTGHDEDNIVICQMAQRYFRVPRQIARVNNPKNEPIFRLLGIEETVSSTGIIYNLIDQEVETGESLLLTALKRGKIVIATAELQLDSPGTGRLIKDIHLPGECVLAAIIRDDHILLPSGTTRLEAGDTVIAVTSPQDQQSLRVALLGSEAPRARQAAEGT